ncbi:hypothetical protein [Legionella yabuuchiae]|uniref:hypothetical protein n=1 Tax=Legionella yabuuchiae TaxID=376727 RepID=UPI001054BB5E|nr:hypothetical protein [Legionella yabuuchiae]
MNLTQEEAQKLQAHNLVLERDNKFKFIILILGFGVSCTSLAFSIWSLAEEPTPNGWCGLSSSMASLAISSVGIFKRDFTTTAKTPQKSQATETLDSEQGSQPENNKNRSTNSWNFVSSMV